VNDTSGRAQETRAMMALLQEHRFTMSANIHSGEEVVNYPWDHQETVHTDDAWLQFVSREYADEARVVDPNYMSLFTDGITNGAQWYKIFGGRQDYVTYYLEGRELTLELCTDFRLNSELLNEYWLKNQRSLINYMSQCLYGIRGLVTDADSGLPLEALVEIPGHDNYHSSVHSSAAYGDFYRLLEEDSYDLVVSSPGYHSDTIPGVHVVNYQAILLNIALQTVKSSSQGDASVAFRIYPNPADSELFIQPACEPGVVELMIYSSEGILFRKESSHYTGAPMRVGLNELPSGPFLLRISSAEQTIVRMLIRE
ncbi:MAG: hypothetical protein GY790_02950, partial [Bacteroidetes bacterium]|nr:hypothetical protein [Bacteroidota bacterium]